MKLNGQTLVLMALILVPPKLTFAICAIGDAVSSTVTDTNQGLYMYSLVVSNPNCGTAPLNGFFLPYFSDAGIMNLTAPNGWTVNVDLNTDLFGLGGGIISFLPSTPMVLDRRGSIGGFSFKSTYAPVKGPFAVSMTISGARSLLFGDPLIPASPSTLQALGIIPEPCVTALLALGIFLCLFVLRRQQFAV
jgi:hypothetical protein